VLPQSAGFNDEDQGDRQVNGRQDMTNITFDDEMGRLQRALAQCEDMVVRRSAVVDALNLRAGERVLEVGCGGGFYAHEAAKFVGPKGRVAAIDISADQIAAARERCAAFPWVECQVANAADLPYGEAEFDAAYGVQVIEYMVDFGKALREMYRVLRPGGRFINLATNFTSIVWHSEQPQRMRRVMDAFLAHAPHPDLPAILSPALRKAGFQPIRQRAVPIVNTSYTENSFSTLVAKMIAGYVVGREAVTSEEANDWLAEFAVLEESGEYFYSATPIITEAIKVS
jgi:ubiquinone/menaquinone biosynthesis C-methylase UbiE